MSARVRGNITFWIIDMTYCRKGFLSNFHAVLPNMYNIWKKIIMCGVCFFCAPFVIEPHRLCPGLGQDPKGHKKICDKIRYLRGASIIYHGQLQWLFNKIIGKKMIVNRVCLSCFQSKFHSLTFHKACALCRRNFLIKNIKIFVFIEFFFVLLYGCL